MVLLVLFCYRSKLGLDIAMRGFDTLLVDYPLYVFIAMIAWPLLLFRECVQRVAMGKAFLVVFGWASI